MTTPASAAVGKLSVLGAAALTVTALLWASNHATARSLRADVPFAVLLTMRWLIAYVIVLPFGLPAMIREWPVIRRCWPMLVGAGLFGIVLFSITLFGATSRTEVIHIGMLNSTTPIWLLVIGWITGRETLSLSRLAGVLLGFAGCLLLIGRGDPTVIAHLTFNVGDLLALSSALIWAIYTLIIRTKPPELSQMSLLAATVTVGMVFILPYYLWSVAEGGPALVNDWANPELGWVLLAIVFIGIGPTLIGNVLWNQGVARVGAARAGAFLYLIPIFAAGLGILMLGEHAAWYHAVGIACILPGMWLAVRKP